MEEILDIFWLEGQVTERDRDRDRDRDRNRDRDRERVMCITSLLQDIHPEEKTKIS